MNIIIVSNQLEKARSVTLSAWQAFFAVLSLALLAVATTLVLQLMLMRFAPDALYSEWLAWLPDVQGEQRQQRYVHSSLDVLAGQVGKMQAEVQRLNALGVRLTKLAGINSAEFQFDQPPAQGGPLLALPPQEMSIDNLQQQLDQLRYSLGDRSDKLLALQAVFIENQLDREMSPSIAPVQEGWRSSGFGWRLDPLTGKNAMHEGVDYVALKGTAIYASAGGVVSYANRHAQYGKMVEIDHGKDTLSRYAHASRLLVKVGQVASR